MNRSKKNTSTKRKRNAAPGQSRPDVPRRSVQIKRDLLKGLLLVVLLGGIKIGVEHTYLGRQAERFCYDWLQRRLSAETVPVMVVDISALKPVHFDTNGQTGIATPRTVLQDLITALSQQQPRAIGVDIDFSPDSSGYIWPRDPEFFEFCMRINIPVFLGISRSEALSPKQWLGSEDYEVLAASMIVPNDDTRKMPKWIRVGKHSTPGPTLSAALAGSFQETQSKLAHWLHQNGLVEQVAEKELGEGVEVGQFPVDYSALRTLMADKTVHTINPDVIRDQGQMFRNKIVLIGSGVLGDNDDRFRVAGFEQEVPGVYIHASAAYTLHDAPLYELTAASRVVIDFLLSLFVLLSIIGVRLYFMNRTTRNVRTHRLQLIVTLCVIAAALVAGVLFVDQTRVFWTDFVLAPVFLILHLLIERLFEKRPKTTERPKQLIRDLILEEGDESQ